MNGTYPVHVDGTLDPPLSRWLWLVKWLLVIPHYVVLFFLWIAFVAGQRGRVLRHPVHRPLPAGALRLQRRGAALDLAGLYYAYSALGTDRYPPFSLGRGPGLSGAPGHRLPGAAVPRPGPGEVVAAGHPALHRRRLLRRRRYLVPAASGTGGLAGSSGSWRSSPRSSSPFTGSYPRDLFDLVLGLNRWVCGSPPTRPDDRRLPALPAGHGRFRPGHRTALGDANRTRLRPDPDQVLTRVPGAAERAAGGMRHLSPRADPRLPGVLASLLRIGGRCGRPGTEWQPTRTLRPGHRGRRGCALGRSLRLDSSA